MRPIIDAHLDLAWNALSYGRDLTQPLTAINAYETGMTDDKCRGHATVSLPDMHAARVRLCAATLLARVKPQVRPAEGFDRRDIDYQTSSIAHGVVCGQLGYYHWLQQCGLVRMIGDAAALDDHWRDESADAPLGVILTMEGADPMGSPDDAAAWFDRGLRVVNLVHNRQNQYAVGTGADGPLTDDGRALLGVMQQHGMILDLTHLSDQSMGEAFDLYDGPMIASHHLCRALSPHPRQLTDQQIRMIIERGGVIGIAVNTWMMRPDWTTGVTPRHEVTLSMLVDHIDHLCQLAGDCKHVGIGSDLDGGFGNEATPNGIDAIGDLHKLDSLLKSRGYSDADIEAIFYGNWLRYFRQHLPQVG